MGYFNWATRWFTSGEASDAKAAAGQAEGNAAKSDMSQARKSISSAMSRASTAAKDNSRAAGEGVEHKTHDATHKTEETGTAATDNTAAGSHNAVDKLRHPRPKMSSHDSTGDKFKHVFGLDRKEHKAEAAARSRCQWSNHSMITSFLHFDPT